MQAAPLSCRRCGAPLGPLGPDGETPPCARCLLAAGLESAGEGPALAEAAAPADLAPFFPQLEIEALVGRGGMGTVYRARHRGLGRRVALKVLDERLGNDERFALRFEREAQALARLAHPNIVGIHDAGRAAGLCYLTMEYVDGTSLRDLLEARKEGAPLEPPRALAIVRQICAALEYAHAEGVVHRDIKPENVLLDRAGVVKIADFGLAKIVEAPGAGKRTPALTRATQAMGTPHYMAPEQLERPREVDHRADIYSLGVVFYELLTGELPLGRFDAPSRKVEVDVRLDEVVLKALEKEPARRYQRASEVATAVDATERAPSAAPETEVRAPETRPDALPSARAIALPYALHAAGAAAIFLVWHALSGLPALHAGLRGGTPFFELAGGLVGAQLALAALAGWGARIGPRAARLGRVGLLVLPGLMLLPPFVEALVELLWEQPLRGGAVPWERWLPPVSMLLAWSGLYVLWLSPPRALSAAARRARPSPVAWRIAATVVLAGSMQLAHALPWNAVRDAAYVVLGLGVALVWWERERADEDQA